MKLSKTQLRQLILNEVISIVEGSDGVVQRIEVNGFEFAYTTLGKTIEVNSATKNGKAVTSGYIYDGRELKIAKMAFKNKYKDKTVKFEF